MYLHRYYLVFFYLAIKMEREQLLCKPYFMHSVWSFNKPCLQSFLIISNYSVEIQKPTTAGWASSAEGPDSQGTPVPAPQGERPLAPSVTPVWAQACSACLNLLHEDKAGILIKWCCPAMDRHATPQLTTGHGLLSHCVFGSIYKYMIPARNDELVFTHRTTFYFQASPVNLERLLADHEGELHIAFTLKKSVLTFQLHDYSSKTNQLRTEASGPQSDTRGLTFNKGSASLRKR